MTDNLKRADNATVATVGLSGTHTRTVADSESDSLTHCTHTIPYAIKHARAGTRAGPRDCL